VTPTSELNRLQELHDGGVSIWLDTLSRESGAYGETSARKLG
jgi:hypothetical protein